MNINLPSGHIALIDDEDFEKISHLSWFIEKRKNKTYVRSGLKKDFPRIYLHQLIMNSPKGLVVDHINGNGLDNRKKNMRICTQEENATYRKTEKTNNNLRGVYFSETGRGEKKWWAQIYKDRKSIYLGNFYTAEEAASAYNKAAIDLHGEFCVLNIIGKP